MTDFSKMKGEFNPKHLTEMEHCMEILKEAEAFNLKPEVIKIKDALHVIYPKGNIVNIYQTAFKCAINMIL